MTHRTHRLRSPSSTRRASRSSSALLSSCVALVAALAIGACGGDDGDGGADGGGTDCGFTDDLLPFELGYNWTYQVTDVGTSERTIKSQEVTAVDVTDPDLPGMMFIQQTTIKSNGRTVSLLAWSGDQLLRYKQEDYDDLGDFEQKTIYTPPRIRIDQNPAQLTPGTMFSESYDATVTDALNMEVTTARVDEWTVMANAPCTSPFGDFDCVTIRRQRTTGGVADKTFGFVAGIGKIREDGLNQIEELTGCGTN